MLNFSSIVKSRTLGYRAFHVERTICSFVNEGELVKTSSLIAASGIITPATEKELSLLPEGKRSQEIIKVLTVEKLQDNESDADIIIYHGKRYQVFKTKPWQDYGFFRSFAERVR